MQATSTSKEALPVDIYTHRILLLLQDTSYPRTQACNVFWHQGSTIFLENSRYFDDVYHPLPPRLYV